ncbi:hypothetical protein PIB30_058512 [Stylosanthes scabra]|uniref:Uncharacterized protein n=1 Tax=Stylosanthes scabra TaxID=79078 RepID=A0ABU6WI67_9FABA|nr:hypothetical protein [Stylosanthes scabra]
MAKENPDNFAKLKGLPRGIIHATSNFEMRPLWLPNNGHSNVYNVASPDDCLVSDYSNRDLLPMPVGITQMNNVNDMVKKFLTGKFTIILFHYVGKVDEWSDLDWSRMAIHIAAQNQTKWKTRDEWGIFYIPDKNDLLNIEGVLELCGLRKDFYIRILYLFMIISISGMRIYGYIEIVQEEGLEISQPALDPNSVDIHHRITVRARMKKVHRRVYELRGKTKCSEESQGPPCTGFVEGMASVFSLLAWFCILYRFIVLPFGEAVGPPRSKQPCPLMLFGRWFSMYGKDWRALEQRLSCLRVTSRLRVWAVETATDLIIGMWLWYGCVPYTLWVRPFPELSLCEVKVTGSSRGNNKRCGPFPDSGLMRDVFAPCCPFFSLYCKVLHF